MRRAQPSPRRALGFDQMRCSAAVPGRAPWLLDELKPARLLASTCVERTRRQLAQKALVQLPVLLSEGDLVMTESGVAVTPATSAAPAGAPSRGAGGRNRDRAQKPTLAIAFLRARYSKKA